MDHDNMSDSYMGEVRSENVHLETNVQECTEGVDTDMNIDDFDREMMEKVKEFVHPTRNDPCQEQAIVLEVCMDSYVPLSEDCEIEANPALEVSEDLDLYRPISLDNGDVILPLSPTAMHGQQTTKEGNDILQQADLDHAMTGASPTHTGFDLTADAKATLDLATSSALDNSLNSAEEHVTAKREDKKRWWTSEEYETLFTEIIQGSSSWEVISWKFVARSAAALRNAWYKLAKHGLPTCFEAPPSELQRLEDLLDRARQARSRTVGTGKVKRARQAARKAAGTKAEKEAEKEAVKKARKSLAIEKRALWVEQNPRARLQKELVSEAEQRYKGLNARRPSGGQTEERDLARLWIGQIGFARIAKILRRSPKGIKQRCEEFLKSDLRESLKIAYFPDYPAELDDQEAGLEDSDTSSDGDDSAPDDDAMDQDG